MTAKRFKLLPNPNKDAWDIIDYEASKKIDGYVIYNDLGCIYFSSVPQLCDLLNRLNNENEQLKQLLDYADDLIQSHLSEHFIRQWRNFKTGHKEYNDFWEEKLKIYKESEVMGMTEEVDVKLKIQENNCVDGIIILISPELYKLIKEDKTVLKRIFDNILEDKWYNDGDV